MRYIDRDESQGGRIDFTQADELDIARIERAGQLVEELRCVDDPEAVRFIGSVLAQSVDPLSVTVGDVLDAALEAALDEAV